MSGRPYAGELNGQLETNGSRTGERQVLSYWKHGGASRDRTDDLIVANDAVTSTET